MSSALSQILPHQLGSMLSHPEDPFEHLNYPFEEPGHRPQTPEGGWPDASHLDELQVGRREPLGPRTIREAIYTYASTLPVELGCRVKVDALEFDRDIFREGRRGLENLRYVLARAGADDELRDWYKGLRRSMYAILAVRANGRQWVTVVLHKRKEKTPDSGGGGGGYNVVAHWAVIDPDRRAGHERRVRMVENRIIALLERGGFRFSWGYDGDGPDGDENRHDGDRPDDGPRDVWTPPQDDAHSDGLRCYQACKTTMDRLLQIWEANGGSGGGEGNGGDDVEQRGYHESLWNDHSGWLDEDAVRWDMIGQCARGLVRELRYSAKVSVEVVHRIVRRDRKNKQYGEHFQLLADRMRPPSYYLDDGNEDGEERKEDLDAYPRPEPRPHVAELPREKRLLARAPVDAAEEAALAALLLRPLRPHLRLSGPEPGERLRAEDRTRFAPSPRADRRGPVWRDDARVER
ncbi:hypothetical protein GGR56DRAFT_694161 [Xylariaceae sp. FL0804]|nr:hypothetical protein GGR56DRAFT_694161 [Xylariaceae sp. FL0804]